MDRSNTTVGLDEFGLELVMEEGVGLEPEEASGAGGSADVGPGVAEGDESVAVSPAVEAALSAEVAEVECDAGGDKTRKFRGKKGRTGDGRAVEGGRERGAQLINCESERGSDGLVSEEADVVDRVSLLAALLEEQSEVAQAAAELLGLGLVVVIDQVFAGSAAPVDVEANDSGSVAHIDARGGDRSSQSALKGLGVTCGVEHEEGASGREKSASFACPASEVSEAQTRERARSVVEADEGKERGVSGLEESFEPAGEALEQVELGVSRGALGGSEGLLSESSEGGQVKEARGVEGGEGSDQGVSVVAVDASEELTEGVPVASESEGGEDRLNAGSESFASRGFEPRMEALPEGSERGVIDDGGREILVERRALVDDSEARKRGVGRVG